MHFMKYRMVHFHVRVFIVFFLHFMIRLKRIHYEKTKSINHENFLVFFRVFACPVKPFFCLTGVLSCFRG
jgi:hypothetical protein